MFTGENAACDGPQDERSAAHEIHRELYQKRKPKEKIKRESSPSENGGLLTY